MNLQKCILCIVASLLIAPAISAKTEKQSHQYVTMFRVGGDSLSDDLRSSQDATTLQELESFLSQIKNLPNSKIVKAKFFSAVSPEGSVDFNTRLSLTRLLAIEKFVRSRIQLPDSIVTYDNRFIEWNKLAASVARQQDMPYKEQVLAILNSTQPKDRTLDTRRQQLLRLEGGRAWNELHARHLLDSMRYAGVEFTVNVEIEEKPAPVVAAPVVEEKKEEEKKQIIILVASEKEAKRLRGSNEQEQPKEVKEKPQFNNYFRIKTNLRGWAMAQANLELEFDFAKRWSVVIPVYYGGTDYFVNTIKFRTFNIKPELRHYFLKNRSLFLGIHGGFSFFNYAFGGEYRYQDQSTDHPIFGQHLNLGELPSLGGGITIGYRLPLSKKNDRWNVEFSIGAGVYNIKYDMFLNQENGAFVGSKERLYIGIDNVGVTFSYGIGYNKNRGSKAKNNK